MTVLETTSGSFTSYAHRILWDASRRHLALSESQDPDTSWTLHLSAGLLAAAAFEAYLNYIGESVLPDLWAKERAYFSRAPYRGTEGKLLRIGKELGWPIPSKSRRPMSGWVELRSIRDRLVHAKPKRTSYRITHKQGKLPPAPLTWLYREAPADRVRKLIADTEALASSLHSALRASEHADIAVGSHPFIGLLGFGEHSVELGD